MKRDRDLLFLSDMVACVERVLEYSSGGREEFLKDPMRRDAIVRNLEVLGEAAKRVSPGVRDAHPHVPWREIAGMRDKLIHDYGQVDAHRVWDVVEGKLPRLLSELRAILRSKGG